MLNHNPPKTSLTIGDGKYTVEHVCGTELRALRYGEPWRDLVGDGLFLALVQEIETLRERLETLRTKVPSTDTPYCPSFL